MVLRRARKIGKKEAIFDGSTWGGKEVSFGGFPQRLGTEVLMEAHPGRVNSVLRSELTSSSREVLRDPNFLLPGRVSL